MASCDATREGCVGSGVCAFGCPTSAKQHVGITYVPRAEAAGAQVITGADVRHVLVERGAARGVEARLAGGGRLEVRAPNVVVATGTIHTPLLLARSGLGRASGQLGRNLALHPATGAFALMDEVVDMAKGVPQSFYVDEFAVRGDHVRGRRRAAVVRRDVAAADAAGATPRRWRATATSRCSA